MGQRSGSLLELSTAAQRAIIAGARDAAPVQGLTHGYYKYPARFSPAFVRAAIQTFTKPGDSASIPMSEAVPHALRPWSPVERDRRRHKCPRGICLDCQVDSALRRRAKSFIDGRDLDPVA